MLYLIGLGLSDEKDISLKGLEAIRACDTVYLETYTSTLNVTKEVLETLYNKELILSDRKLVEENAEKTILADAKIHNTAFLVVGDVFSATTHVDLWLRAKELGIKTQCIHNAGVFSGISETGLQPYKFGKTTSIPFHTKSYRPETPYDIIKQNLNNEMHTLVLLDLDPINNRYMTASEAIGYLLEIEDKRKEGVFTKNILCVACARLGSETQIIKSGKAAELKTADLGKPLHCLIVPAKLHFIEEKALSFWEQAC